MTRAEQAGVVVERDDAWARNSEVAGDEREARLTAVERQARLRDDLRGLGHGYAFEFLQRRLECGALSEQALDHTVRFVQFPNPSSSYSWSASITR